MDLLAISIIIYIILMFALAFWANTKIENVEDFLVAGRRLPLALAWATLFATWVGAGAVLTSADEVRQEGLRVSAMEPFGAGVCLILAGLFYAKPLWEMKICTFSDFFRVRFGGKSELISAVISVPAYFGWIAVQMIALAGLVKVSFGIELKWAILLVAVVATAYTLLGGMWSVTLTDAFQVVLLIIGLLILAYQAFAHYAMEISGQSDFWMGVSGMYDKTSSERLTFIPRETVREFVGWLSLFLVGAIGNLPGQDLTQRIFSAKSGKVASQACLLAGVLYIVIGILPVSLGLLADLTLSKEITEGVLPVIADRVLTPAFSVVFVLTLLSIILSTIDSAILAPASVLSQNIVGKTFPKYKSSLRVNQLCVLFVAIASLAVAYIGEDAYSLLESSYAVGLVCLFAPFTMGIFTSMRSEAAAIAAMVVGILVWSLGFVIDSDFASNLITLGATVASFVAYYAAYKLIPK